MQYNLDLSFENIVLFLFLMTLAIIIWNFITSGNNKKTNKQPKGFKKYKYRKNERQIQNEAAAKRWKQKTKSYRDPGMISNEPLDYEKAKNLKYHDYIQAQWDELNKNY